MISENDAAEFDTPMCDFGVVLDLEVLQLWCRPCELCQRVLEMEEGTGHI